MDANYDKLRELLSEQKYPHRYIHKFIGEHTPGFLASMERLEEAFPKITRVSSRESAGKKQPLYLACTYELMAEDPEEIIDLLKATALMTDLKIIL